MRRSPIQKNPKGSITEKRKFWNSVRVKFVKKTSLPNPVKSFGIVKCYSSSSPIPIKNHCNPATYNCEKIWSWSKRPKIILEIRKKTTFLSVSFPKLLPTAERRLTTKTLPTTKKVNRVIVFKSRPFSNILKYRDHWSDPPTILKTRFVWTLTEEIS